MAPGRALQVVWRYGEDADAIAAGLADAGIASEPAARADDLGFIPLADERFDLASAGKPARI